MRLSIFALSFVLPFAAVANARGDDEPRRTVVALELPAPKDTEDSTGGLLVADVDDDRRPDFLITVRGHLGVYANDGKKLWILQTDLVVGGQSESQGLPGHHGPGVAAGDVDGDGKTELVFLTRDRVLHVVEGASGREKATARPPVPSGAERWELAMIADFRGTGGDRDLLLQATNKDGYRTGRYPGPAHQNVDTKAGCAVV
ncbi:MAG: VCBS repeat-containing protein, partial [Planctomycetes bacterium]|nr:VCBS repeat-containing protein [Planctomycetota bacterium]